MNIYNNHRPASKIHRKVYIENFGPIPKEPNGRSYEIHHIDGNPSNNNPSNLVALTLQEHYDVHYQQGDYRACAIIAGKLGISPDELSRLNSLAAQKRVAKGTHPWLGEQNPSIKKMRDGTHLFLNLAWQKEL